MCVQVKISPGMAATHNFILDHDPHDIDNYLIRNEEPDLDPNLGQTSDNEFGFLADGAVTCGVQRFGSVQFFAPKMGNCELQPVWDYWGD